MPVSRIEGQRNIQQEPNPLEATAEVQLERVAGKENLSVDDWIALQDADLRRSMSDSMLRVFRLANGVTLCAIGILVALDEVNIWNRVTAPGDRIITQQVLMTLLGATTVQVGTIAVIMPRYLFPDRSRSR